MKKQKTMKAVLSVLILIFTVSSVMIIKYFYMSNKQAKLYDLLRRVIAENATDKVMKYSDELDFLPEYQELYLANTDMVGWIKIEDTKIDYPVMQSKGLPDFYLNHDFEKSYSNYGCPYVQEDCDVTVPSDNLIIYGHHMGDGSMFAGLLDFENQSFWENHKTITFNTLTDRQTYEIFAVFKTVVYTDSPDSFKYYRFVDANTPKDFENYVENCKALSLYDTGVEAAYGDQLITLSTCEYSKNNGRLVVVAKRISNDP